MADAYASLEDLKDRLDWDLSPAEERMAKAALEDASDDARTYGREWNYDTAPRQVRRLVLKACKRYLDNPEGFEQSRAGDESVTWKDRGEGGGGPQFTAEEIAILRELAGKTPYLMSVPTETWGTRRVPEDVLVDFENGGDPIRFTAAEEAHW